MKAVTLHLSLFQIDMYGLAKKVCKFLNYLWRVFATAWCFSLFGFGSLFLALFVFPFQKLFVRKAEEQKVLARTTVHYTFKFFIKMMAVTGIFTFDLSKAQSLTKIKGQLVLANHPSLIDVVVLISIIPHADCVVKTHLFNNVFLRKVLKSTGYISNADPEGLLTDCQASLAAGNNLIIFPQGTRIHTNERAKFQRGAANIALRCQANITAVLLNVVPTTLTKNEPWYQIPAKKAVFSAISLENTPKAPKVESVLVSKQVRAYNCLLEDFFKKELNQYE
jgi:1-acyl-sn-glycerol-3-phosphate acyltransferase